MNSIISSRAFSLPKKFYQDNFEIIQNFNDNQALLSVFDNNRYVSRDRTKVINLDSLKLKLFNYDVTINYKAMIHSSNNVVIIIQTDLNNKLLIDEYDSIINNWIPSEHIFSYKENKLHIRNILNFGFLLFFSKVFSKDILFDNYLNLKKLKEYQYEDQDIQEIEKIFSHFQISNNDMFFIPSMYGSSFIVDNDTKEILEKKYGQFNQFIDNTEVFIERNFAFILSDHNPLQYANVISFFNLLKHLKNRIGSEVSLKLDNVNSLEKTDYAELLKESFDLQQELTVNYDEFNNINIWHNGTLLELSKIIRSEEGWNMANEFEENKNKLQEFIKLTTEMSKGKFQSFMDSVSLLIGILGVFAIFDLIQVLNAEPYTGMPWGISFMIIILFLPLFLFVLAKKSHYIMKIFNKFL